jgi:D-alanine--poly(phosphoribitol) ligase subunit 1
LLNTEIGIITNDDLDTYAAIFATWFSGKAYVPLSPDTSADRNNNIIEQVGLKTILDSSDTMKLEAAKECASMENIVSQVRKFDFCQQLAYIFFTSGSTGVPKGVTISKNNVASFVKAFWRLGYNIHHTDRCLQMFELTFDLSVMSFLVPLLKGACVYTIPQGKVKYSYIYYLMEERELTIALMVPSILNYLRPYFSEIHCPKMRYSLFCGEALNLQIAREWANCVPNARIDNVYGPTENTIFCTCYSLERDAENISHNGILSIGKSMLDCLAIVFNEIGEEAKIHEVGELCLAGAQLTPGYFKNPTLDRDLFFVKTHNGHSTRFYLTGDLCQPQEDGNINFIGRKDTQVKIQGFRVELSEVEFYARQAVRELINLVAMAIENKAGNIELIIVFESPAFDLCEVKLFMKSKLPPYMIPTQYYFIENLPLNTNGKIDRKKLKTLI